MADPVADWIQAKAKDRMTEVLRAQPKIDVVYGHNDPMAIGAYLAAKELGREKEMIFVGVDGLGGPAGGIKKVMDGVLAATFVYPLCVDKAVEIGQPDPARAGLPAAEGLHHRFGHGDAGERGRDVQEVHGAGDGRVKLLLVCCLAASAQTWVRQESGTSASLRGVSAVNARVVWASGTGGTYLKTTDGGAHWTAAQVPGAESLDFRDVHAVDDRTVYLLSAGTGDKARIYKTTDGGAHWTLQLTNPDAQGFFDALAFWDAEHGIAIGDPVDGRFAVFTTDDGGAHWQRRQGPEALPGEGAFAASGTCLIARSARDAWFGTGGARVFHSTDGGLTWQVSSTPMRHDKPSAGIFSLAFSDARHGVAVGGDYAKDQENARQCRGDVRRGPHLERAAFAPRRIPFRGSLGARSQDLDCGGHLRLRHLPRWRPDVDQIRRRRIQRHRVRLVSSRLGRRPQRGRRAVSACPTPGRTSPGAAAGRS